jgi:PAS domain S-box-containing protein
VESVGWEEKLAETTSTPGHRVATERLAVEAGRRGSTERFAELLEAVPDAVVMIDGKGRMVLVNEQSERLFGYERRELLGERVEMLLPPRTREPHSGHRSGYFADPRTRPMGLGLDLAGRRKDGTEFPVDISLSAVETGKRWLATAFVRDMTERTLRADLERNLAERRILLAHLVTAAEEERRRIASDIHDDSIQAITAASMRLQMLRLGIEDPEQVALIDEVDESVRLAIERLRHLVFELRPPVLGTEGLAAALSVYVKDADQHSQTRYLLEDRLTAQPTEQARLILYRIAQEALANVRKHAAARRATVTLAERDGGYFVRVADDGIGFAAGGLPVAPGHVGLASMRERADLAGGWLRVASEPGAGTNVEFWIPAGNRQGGSSDSEGP